MVLVLPNKVFYGNDVVQRDLYLESRDKQGNSEHTDDDEHDKEAYVVNTQKKLVKNRWWCNHAILLLKKQ